MKIYLTRHGHTAGNLEARYVGGRTDEPLCEKGLAQLKYQTPKNGIARVYISPLARTKQTAAILYPGAKTLPLAQLREMDFGVFEGKNWQELEHNPAYRAWVEGGCQSRCPGGEDIQSFTRRCLSGFQKALRAEAGEEEIHFVVHGGTIMALLSQLATPTMGYFEATTPPGGHWLCEGDETALTILHRPKGNDA